MRILYVINDLRVGGAERLLVDLAPRLRNEGFAVSVQTLAAASDSYLDAALREQDISVRVPASSDGAAMRSPKHIRALARAMRECDVVHVQLFPAQLWVALAARFLTYAERRRVTLVTTEQNTHNRRRTPLFRPLDTWMYAQFDRIVAITDATADALAAWVPATRSKTEIIHNAVPLERFATATPIDRGLLGVPPDVRLLTCVGRLETQKDHATLLRALHRLPADVHAVLIGGGELQPSLKAQCAAAGITNRVHFLGRRADVADILKASDVYVQPSRWEGFGIAVVEAMAAGVPVVVSDVPGMSEVVGDAGLRCPSGDAPAFAAAIERLLDNSELRQTHVERGHQRARDFSIEACVAAHAALYRKKQKKPLPPESGEGVGDGGSK